MFNDLKLNIKIGIGFVLLLSLLSIVLAVSLSDVNQFEIASKLEAVNFIVMDEEKGQDLENNGYFSGGFESSLLFLGIATVLSIAIVYLLKRLLTRLTQKADQELSDRQENQSSQVMKAATNEKMNSINQPPEELDEAVSSQNLASDFAVCSSEINALLEAIQRSAKENQNIIEQIQTENKETELLVNQGKFHANRCIEQANYTNEILLDIQKLVTSLKLQGSDL